MSNYPAGVGLQLFDNSGNPAAGALLYFYETGTTTPLATYSDSDLTSANANPVVADGNGRVGAIYMKAQAYTVVCKTSAGVTIWTRNDVYAFDTFETQPTPTAVSPYDYGAIGDGVADESSEVQSAIDATAGVVDLLGGTFRCDSGLTLDAGVTLRNGTLDFTNCPDDNYIFGTGSRGSPVLLSSNAAAADESIAVASAAGVSQGDWLFIYSDALFNGGSDKGGEVVLVESIVGSTINLAEPLVAGYTTANNAAFQKLTLLDGITIENLTILCNSAASGQGRAIRLDFCVNAVVRGVRVSAPKAVGIQFRSSVNCSVADCFVACDPGTGNGIDAMAHSRSIFVDRCAVLNAAIGFRVGAVDAADGVCRYVQIRSCEAFGCTTGASLLANSEFCTLNGLATKPSGGTLYSNVGSKNRIIGWDDILASNYNGLTAVGGGSGAGMHGTGGATGYGLHGVGGSTSGAGVYGKGTAGNSSGGDFLGQGSGSGVKGTGGATSGAGVVGVSGGSNGQGGNFTGSGSGAGVYGESGDTGYGVHGFGGGTSGAGVYGAGQAGNSDGVKGQGQGSAAGVYGTGGATGNGVHGVGGATSGVGVVGVGTAGNSRGGQFTGQGSAAGVHATGGDTGYGVHGVGGATSGAGVYGAATASNYSGVIGVGQGGGNGVVGTAGATGYGVYGAGGATSGAGVVGVGSASAAAGVQGTGGATGYGVQGTGGATSGHGVYGSATGAASSGVYGTGGLNGVYGVTSDNGGGVWGKGNTGAVGVGCETDGDCAPIYIVPSTKPSGVVVPGMLYVDTSYILWICTVGGTGAGATWTKVGLQS